MSYIIEKKVCFYPHSIKLLWLKSKILIYLFRFSPSVWHLECLTLQPQADKASRVDFIDGNCMEAHSKCGAGGGWSCLETVMVVVNQYNLHICFQCSEKIQSHKICDNFANPREVDMMMMMKKKIITNKGIGFDFISNLGFFGCCISSTESNNFGIDGTWKYKKNKLQTWLGNMNTNKLINTNKRYVECQN